MPRSQTQTEITSRDSGNMKLADRWRAVTDAAAPVDMPDARLVVMAPHPDDESLMCGGLIARHRRLGGDVVIVAVTDGGAAYDPGGDPRLARRRVGEQRHASRVLGVDDDPVRLHIPDGCVGANEDRLASEMESLITAGDVVVAPWLHDTHPDHDAVARAAVVAARATSTVVMMAPVWMWHRVSPCAAPSVPLRQIRLTPADVDAKLTALRCHVSQFVRPGGTPILDHDSIEQATWAREYYYRNADLVASHAR